MHAPNHEVRAIWLASSHEAMWMVRSVCTHARGMKYAHILSQKVCMQTCERLLALTAAAQVARDMLIDAENKGLVCRDQSIEGLRFFPNFFAKEA